MNINEEIQKQVDLIIEEKLPAMIKEKVSNMLDGILGNVFQSYSDIGKAVKTKIEKSLDVNLQNYDLIDYNAMVAKSINDKLIEVVNLNSIEPIYNLIKETTGFISKKQINLSEIIEMFRLAAKEDGYDDHGEISVHVEYDSAHKWHDVSLDLEANIKSEKCHINFLISEKGQYIFCFKTRSHWSDKGQLTPSKVTQMSKAEHIIFRLYSANVKVIVDQCDYFDTEWDKNED